jgi:hypothetical protein
MFFACGLLSGGFFAVEGYMVHSLMFGERNHPISSFFDAEGSEPSFPSFSGLRRHK